MCAEWGEEPAELAHRYALSVEGVSTTVAGAKTVGERKQIIAAEAEGALGEDQKGAIDALLIR